MRLLSSFLTLVLAASSGFVAADIDVASSGYASLTHYDLPLDYVASCGCVGRATRYPVAALNRYVYGSNTSFGPACGSCFEVRLVSTPLSPPPPADPATGPWGDGIYYSSDQVSSGKTPNLVVKIIDLCPGVGGPWCNATAVTSTTNTTAGIETITVVQGNSLGFDMHFDLAWPAVGIAKNWFPGDHDYGAWNVSYQAVSCERWAGYKDNAALGSDWDQQSSACCPNNPPPSGTDASCPPYWSTVGLNALTAPNTSNILSKGKGSSNTGSTTALSSLSASILIATVSILLPSSSLLA